MRPYRAIPIGGKDFVYGYYVLCRHHHYILPIHNDSIGFDERWIQEGADDESGWFEVIPETVGQSTGLKDKTGKEIYEGDIMKWANRPGVWPGQLTPSEVKYPFICGNAHLGKIIGNIHQNPKLMEK